MSSIKLICIIIPLILLLWLAAEITRGVFDAKERVAKFRKEYPLFYAIKQNDPELLRQTIKEGHDVNRKMHGQSTIQFAISSTGPKERKEYTLEDFRAWDDRAFVLVDTLIQNGADVSGYPLTIAAKRNLERTVEVLLKAGANPNGLVTEDGLSKPLHSALLIGRESDVILKMLIDYGADVNHRSKSGETPLHLAVLYVDNLLTIKYFLEAGADPSIKNNEGRTALDLAKNIGESNQELINLLETYMEMYGEK